jgi:hypothetical protein
VLTTNVEPVPVCDAIEVAFPIDVMTPVRFAFVVTFPAVKLAAVPLIFVPTSAVGVPSAGVVNVGLLNVPPVIVFPVNVKAAGNDNDTAPVVGDEVISLAVPLTESTAPPPPPPEGAGVSSNRVLKTSIFRDS